MPDLSNTTADDAAHRFAPAAPDEPYVFGACCPGWHSAGTHTDALEDWLSFMECRDIQRVCCLLSGCQLQSSNGNIDAYERVFGTENVRHAPTADHRLIDAVTLREDILPFLDAAVAAEERVVVHCLAGIGRTGQALAAWLVHDRGVDAERAINTVEEMRRFPRDPVRAGNATERELLDRVALEG